MITEAEELFHAFKDVFAWSYYDLKGIPEHIAQHKIELDTSIPPAHQARYRMNPNYAQAVKADLDKLLQAGFIEPVDQATWLSPIVVVPKNGKLRMCIDFRRLNTATKKDPYSLPFTDEVLDSVAGHKMYSFLDGFSGYHQIKINPEDRHKTTFITDWGAFGLKNAPPTYQRVVNQTFKEYVGNFLKLFLYDFSVYSSTGKHLTKLRQCFTKCR
jgi:hypothetical protein